MLITPAVDTLQSLCRVTAETPAEEQVHYRLMGMTVVCLYGDRTLTLPLGWGCVLHGEPRRAVRSLRKHPSDMQLTFPKKILAAEDTAPLGGHLLGSRHQCLLGSMYPGCFSQSVVSDSLRPRGLQHARLP